MDAQYKYDKLKAAVQKMMAAQKDYFRSNRDKQKLIIAKNLEREVESLVSDRPEQQPELFDWLAR
ncbi:MAG: hypothetical protein LC100_11225 [Chitinophagales bacterium]|nr:hypothetical protein [Chitinophagales bacterium]